MANENRSEKPTGRRRAKAREKGQIARSRDLVTALTLLVVTVMLAWEPQLWVGRWREFFARLVEAGYAGEIGPGTSMFSWTALTVVQWIGPVLAMAMAAAVFSTIAQGGVVFSAEVVKPNWDKMNPAANIGRLFSPAALSRALRSLIPGGAIVFFSVSIFRRELETIVHLARFGPRPLLAHIGSLVFELSWKCGMVMLVWSAGDYFLQRWNLERSLMMTKEEIKQERKDTEGNPQIRGKRRSLRRAFLRKLMAKEVARATAVITNPTHYAVAIEYRPETMAAPVVVAKGKNLIAEKIKQIARWNEIPIIENPPLAQALYKATEVGQAIPPKLYVAVAEILAFLYRTKARLQAIQPRVGA